MSLRDPFAGLSAAAAAALTIAGIATNEATSKALLALGVASGSASGAAVALRKHGDILSVEEEIKRQRQVAEKAEEDVKALKDKAIEKEGQLQKLQKAQEETAPVLQNKHLVVPENSKGWSYRRIFGKYLMGCSGIIIKDPYIRAFHQIRNLVEFLCMVNELTPQGGEVTVHLITGADSNTPEKRQKQEEDLKQVKDSFAETATPFSFEVPDRLNFHARTITTNDGWKISLDRGLEIFKGFERSAFNAATNLQEARLTKHCEVTFIRVEEA